MTQEHMNDEKNTKKRKPVKQQQIQTTQAGHSEAFSALFRLQHKIGNRAVQRLIAQRSNNYAQGGELNAETADRINRERSSGSPLESSLQGRLQQATGQDFSGVRIHASPEAAQISQQIGAKAFTTGQDVFFNENAYNPHSGSGQELIAHELTHVVQQSSGAVGSSGRMTVNPAGDAFEQEADSVARALTLPGANPGAPASVQRQVEEEEEEETIQRQVDPGEEEEEKQE